MFENWQKLVSTRKLFILFLRITLLHEIKQNEKHPYASKIYIFLRENQLIQQKQFREQYGLINLTKVEIVESHKLERKLDKEIIQLLHNSFTTLSR